MLDTGETMGHLEKTIGRVLRRKNRGERRKVAIDMEVCAKLRSGNGRFPGQ